MCGERQLGVEAVQQRASSGPAPPRAAVRLIRKYPVVLGVFGNSFTPLRMSTNPE